jgi:sulfur-oxidizing protein SoxY
LIQRRAFLRCSAHGLALVGCGLLARPAIGEPLPAPFRAASFAQALAAMGGEPEQTDRIDLRVASLIEDGASVPVSVQADLPDVREMFVLAETNPVPLAVRFRLPSGTEANLSVRIKLAQSGPVYGAVRAADTIYWTARDVKVTRGGCG